MEIVASEVLVERRVLFVICLRDMSERLAAGQALRDSEIRYRTLIESAPEGIVVIDHAGLVAASGATLLRRSALGTGACPHPGLVPADRPVILLDSIGELSACWGLADIAFVGGSFGNRGGQNMIEPAAYGACILFGPNTWNFRDVVQSFRAASACVQLESPAELLPMVGKLVADCADRRRLGDAAQAVVLRQQGATFATAAMLAELVAASAVTPQSRRDAA